MDAAELPCWREERARLFFALWPDAATAAILHRLGESARQRFGGRCMHRDTLHLTLAFIGGVPRVRIAELLELGAHVRPHAFHLALDILGEWARKHIVWAGPAQAPEPLTALADDLRRVLADAGFAIEARPFVPHVTLLRNAACATRRAPLELPVRWAVHGFVLVESKLLPSGARYEVLGRWGV